MRSSRSGPGWRHLAAIIAAALAALSFTTAPAVAQKPDATELEKVRAYVQPSVVYLGIEYSGYVWDVFNKQYIDEQRPITVASQCTGYVVNPNGYIATAGHCVAPDAESKDAIKNAAAEQAIGSGYYTSTDLTPADVVGDYRIRNEAGEGADPEITVYAGWGVAAGGIQSGQSYPARVIEYQDFEKGDAALLKVEAKNLQAIELVTSEPEVGHDIVSIGYPKSVDDVTDLTYAPSFKDGSVSSKKTTAGGLFKTYEISAAMSGGMSGGPTVDLKHRVIGFNSFNILGEEQQFNFVRPSALTEELLSGAGVKNTLGPVSTDYNRGLDAYFDGDRDQAIESLQRVLDEQPSNELAQEFIKKARNLEESGGLLPIALIVLAVLAVAGGGTAVLMRRGKQRAGATAPTSSQEAVPQPALTQSSPTVTASGATETTTATAVAEREPERKPNFCPSCGDPVHDGERFCSNCGTRLTSD